MIAWYREWIKPHLWRSPSWLDWLFAWPLVLLIYAEARWNGWSPFGLFKQN